MKLQSVLNALVLSLIAMHSIILAKEKPNIVIILTDDQGYADVSYNPHSPPEVSTPNIDALASSSIICTQGYTSGHVCSPTRAGLMTGRYQQRFGVYTAGEGGSGVPLDEVFIPQRLKPAGYVSGAIGKWHLGLTEEYHAMNRGFDEFYGFMGRGAHPYFDHSDMNHPIYRGLKPIMEEGYLTTRITEEAVDFIDRHKDEPFFLYVAYNAVHSPPEAPEADIKKVTGDETRDTLMAMIKHLDMGVREIVNSLKKHDIFDNTLLIFLTDNGGSSAMHANNAPLRGFKQMDYEGGVHVPFIVSWPDKLDGGKKCDVPMWSIDLFATALDAADLPMPKDKPLDGKSILPALKGESDKLHDELYWSSAGIKGKWAVRSGNWKLVADKARRELFDLEKDLSETKDLSKKHPEVVSELTKKYNAWLDEMADPLSRQDKRWSPDAGAPAKKMSKEEKEAAREKKKAERIKERESKNSGQNSVPTESSRTSNTPNVIFMLTDDLGYSDVGCYGAEKVKTPHIDRLAAEGIRFTDFHTAASICSPSRAAFLTGAYPQRAGLYMGINPNRTPHWFLGLHPDENTIAEQFKQQSYATHMVGKWHLGTEPEFLPRKQGFNHYYGMPCNYSHSPKFFDDEEEVFAKTPLDRLTKLYTQRVKSIIHDQAKSGEPFFLYYAHNYPHTPYKSGKDFQGTSQDGVRGDVMQELDWSVGEMMSALKEAGVADNTIIVFTSDNGPTNNKYAQPYSGTKYVTFEGGHRVPFIVHWPAMIKGSRVSNVPVNAMDLFPTLSEIINADMPMGRVYDGESLLPLFEGKTLKRTFNDAFYYYNCENLQAVRRGDWKLHLPRSKEQMPFWDKNKAFANLEHPVLYNLHTDKAESTNVAADHPEVVQQMMSLATSVRGELGEFMQRGKSQRPTGSLFPGVAVISHQRDWNTVDSATTSAIAAERLKRHPNQIAKKAKPQREKR